MGHLFAVNEGQRRGKLLTGARGVPLRVSPLLDNTREQITARTKLHDEIEVALVREGVDEGDDVAMLAHPPEYPHLVSHNVPALAQVLLHSERGGTRRAGREQSKEA